MEANVVAMSLDAKGGAGRMDGESETFIPHVAPTLRAGGNRTGGDRPPGTDVDTCDLLIAHSLRADGFDASEDGTGRGTPLVAIGFYGNDSGNNAAEDQSPTLRAMCGGGGNQHAVAFDPRNVTSKMNRTRCEVGLPVNTLHANPQAVAFTERTRKDGRSLECQEETAYALTNPGSGGRTQERNLLQGMVRRLTPAECEALQGFPRGYTLVPYRGKPAADGPRYRAIGNSMAVPVMRWLGQRIELVDRMLMEHAT